MSEGEAVRRERGEKNSIEARKIAATLSNLSFM
ncbi:MAG: hypothetical protein A4E30_01604 [Methanomassiliicoccales archaeon PtaB.Bin215]|nr:MAG: hypothetical protein A4E30_01604 [Methanomassiliicoccales archaeon PtaB.Bin215]